MKKHNWQKIKDDSAFKQNFVNRTKIIKLIRQFFDNQGFLEVETPQLVALPGMEPFLDPLKTKICGFDGKSQDAYFITSPEYEMKKLLCAGFDKIYQITSSFRNKEDKSSLHNTEFKILEWYKSPGDYKTIMEDTERMIYFVNKNFNNSDYLVCKDKKIDLTLPWKRLTLEQAFREYLDLDLGLLLENRTEFIAQANEKGYLIDENEEWEDVFYKLFLAHIEPKLGWDKPVFLYDYPAEMASLSKVNSKDPRWAERVEFYIAGIELGNGFSELNNADEQESRLKEERELRRENNKDLYDVNMSFIEALRSGMPDAGGIAVGVDRVVMLLLGKESVFDVIFFPQQEMFDI